MLYVYLNGYAQIRDSPPSSPPRANRVEYKGFFFIFEAKQESNIALSISQVRCDTKADCSDGSDEESFFFFDHI